MKQNKKNIISGKSILLMMFSYTAISINSFALIDYTKKTISKLKNSRSLLGKNKVANKPRNIKKMSGMNTDNHSFQFSTQFSSFNVAPHIRDVNRMNKYNLMLNYQYLKHIYVNLDLPFLSADIFKSVTHNELNLVNPKILLGINWFNLGSVGRSTSVDLFLGMIPKVDNDLSSSRVDQFVAFQSKRLLGSLCVTLEGEYRFNGDRAAATEIKIGNSSQFSLGVSYQATSDILFSIKANSLFIKSVTDEKVSNVLKNDIKTTTLTPELLLTLGRLWNVALGGNFSTYSSMRSKTYNIYDMKLWDIDSVYGNSIYINLSTLI